MFAADNHFSQNVCCSARTRNAGGNWLAFSSDACSAGVVNYASLDPTVGSAFGTWDYRFILCTVPPVYSGTMSGLTGFSGKEI